MSCNKCGQARPRPKIVGPAPSLGNEAKAFNGLFSAEDWACLMCGNVNWARRDTCNVCQHPRAGKNENRDGVGGGFKETGNVEYRRGKKRRRHRDETTQSVPPSMEEEDDDDDDDEDASKYDLFAVVDEADVPLNSKNVEKHDEKSDGKLRRSRSRSPKHTGHSRGSLHYSESTSSSASSHTSSQNPQQRRSRSPLQRRSRSPLPHMEDKQERRSGNVRGRRAESPPRRPASPRSKDRGWY